jgi:hypothetical protein
MPNTDLNPQNGLQGSSYLYDYGTSPNTRTAVSQKVRILTPAYGDNKAMHQMGVLSTFSPSSNRSVEPVKSIGFGDKIAELVPNVTEAETAQFERALLYLCNLWQATGYAAGVDGPVRSLRHHRWPFDVEEQLVFSTLADVDLVGLSQANVGKSGTPGQFDGGVSSIRYPEVTNNQQALPGGNRGHSAIITMYEGCWFQSYSKSYSKDAGMISESGDVMISDVHDFASVYGEFLATGNDPSIGQLGSIRFGGNTASRAGATPFVSP